MSLKLFMNPQSRSRIVRWMLEEIGCPYEVEVVNYGPDMKAESYTAINPMGKVPAIQHNGKVITEAAAIVCYLADAFPEAKLAPAPADRAAYYRWLFYAAGPFEHAITNNHLGFKADASKSAMLGYGDYDKAVDILADHLASSHYVAGDAFTAADTYLGMTISFSLHFKTIPPKPAFVDYAKRIAARPAFIKANQLDDALVQN